MTPRYTLSQLLLVRLLVQPTRTAVTPHARALPCMSRARRAARWQVGSTDPSHLKRACANTVDGVYSLLSMHHACRSVMRTSFCSLQGARFTPTTSTSSLKGTCSSPCSGRRSMSRCTSRSAETSSLSWGFGTCSRPRSRRMCRTNGTRGCQPLANRTRPPPQCRPCRQPPDAHVATR